jgi:mitogen-activated protein kinase kinase kinase
MSGSSRLSVGAQSLWERRSKDSDAASVITVDEVTAELETRRASGVSWGGSYSDEEGSVIGSDEDDESDEEESETEASEEEEVEAEEGAPSKPERELLYLF